MLIVHHAGLTAAEQYNPRLTPDESDDFIQAHQNWVRTLRRIRQEFEELITGIIPDQDDGSLRAAVKAYEKSIAGGSVNVQGR